MGRIYKLRIRRVAIGVDIVVSADGYNNKLLTVRAGDTKSLDLAEMFNSLRVAAISDGNGTVHGLDVMMTRRGMGKYRVILDIEGHDVAVMYDKITPVSTGVQWREPQGKTNAL